MCLESPWKEERELQRLNFEQILQYVLDERLRIAADPKSLARKEVYKAKIIKHNLLDISFFPISRHAEPFNSQTSNDVVYAVHQNVSWNVRVHNEICAEHPNRLEPGTVAKALPDGICCLELMVREASLSVERDILF